jgi:hypothetical protein
MGSGGVQLTIPIFRYSELRKFLIFMKKNCRIIPLKEWDGGDKDGGEIIMRHDVDLSLTPAIRLAMLEKECSIKSTFFIMVTNTAYNPLSYDNRSKIIGLRNMGFEVGLHFDPSIYGDVNAGKLRKMVGREAEVLKSITGEKVRSVSLHNPNRFGAYPLFRGYKNAYDPRIFLPDIYLSDTWMRLRTDPYEFVKNTKDRKRTAQIAFHPMHYTDKGDDYGIIFHDAIKDMTGSIPPMQAQSTGICLHI